MCPSPYFVLLCSLLCIASIVCLRVLEADVFMTLAAEIMSTSLPHTAIYSNWLMLINKICKPGLNHSSQVFNFSLMALLKSIY